MSSTIALRHLRRPWWSAAAVGVVTAGLWVAGPVATGGPVTCPFRLITGCDCPLCGATRATSALVHGHVARAAGFNLLYVAFLPLALWAWTLDATGRFETSPHPFHVRRFWWALGAVAVVFTIARNLPWTPIRALHS